MSQHCAHTRACPDAGQRAGIAGLQNGFAGLGRYRQDFDDGAATLETGSAAQFASDGAMERDVRIGGVQPQGEKQFG